MDSLKLPQINQVQYKCKNCGKPVSSDFRICPYCETRIQPISPRQPGPHTSNNNNSQTPLSSLPPDPAQNTNSQNLFVGKFSPNDIKLEKLLSSTSAYGNVYQGKLFSIPVVFKIPKNHTSKKDREQWLKEAEITSRYPCQYIVQFIGSCVRNTPQGDEEMIISFELLHGDLEKLLAIDARGNADINLHQRVDMCMQAARGMNYLHSHGIMHRDLKLDNMMYLKFGTGEHAQYIVKIGDFGLSLVCSNFSHASQNWEFGPALDYKIGNLGCRAPEKMKYGEYTNKADVYSFGVCIWSIVTGLNIENEEWGTGDDGWASEKDFIHAVLELNGRPDINKIDGRLTGLRELVSQCWSFDATKKRDQNQRPSFEQVLAHLELILPITQRLSREDKIRSIMGGEGGGAQFWIKYFLDKDVIAWDVFAPAFYEFIGEKLNKEYHNKVVTQSRYHASLSTETGSPSQDRGNMSENEQEEQRVMQAIRSESNRYECLRTLFMNITGAQKLTLDLWKKFCSWLGPPYPPQDGQKSWMDRFVEWLADVRMFFHGVCNNTSLILSPQHHKPGTYLVRFSMSSSGSFVISFLNPQGAFKEVPVHQRKLGAYCVKLGKKEKDFNSLKTMVQFLESQRMLVSAIKGPFANLFE